MIGSLGDKIFGEGWLFSLEKMIEGRPGDSFEMAGCCREEEISTSGGIETQPEAVARDHQVRY